MRRAVVRFLGVLALAGCGRSKERDAPPPAPVTRPTTTTITTLPEPVVHVSIGDDPGFDVSLAAAARFGTFNRMLPGEQREPATWASLELTLADGTTQVIEAPATRFGAAGYALRAGTPGIRLVVFDPASQAEKASFGPLKSIHVTPVVTRVPLAIVIDRKPFTIDQDQLAAVPTVTDPVKQQPAWPLPAVIAHLAPACAHPGFVLDSAEGSTSVAREAGARAFLRVNRKGAWMASVGAAADADQGKQLRDLTRIVATCATSR